MCRNEIDPSEHIHDTIITISQDEKLYGFCFFTVPNTERSREEVAMAKPFEANVYARFNVKFIKGTVCKVGFCEEDVYASLPTRKQLVTFHLLVITACKFV